MTLQVFAAAPGILLIERDASVEPANIFATPIVGWQHIQGSSAFPICAMPHKGLSHGKAILHPEGYVTDPTHGLVFKTLAEWLNFMKTAEPADEDAGPDPELEDAAVDFGLSTGGGPRREPTAVLNSEPEWNRIAFGEKAYKTTSFWLLHDKDGNDIGVFSIEGQSPYPNDEFCRKITRDEFATAKRRGTPVIDPKAERAVEDDDDGMDLV